MELSYYYHNTYTMLNIYLGFIYIKNRQMKLQIMQVNLLLMLTANPLYLP